MARGVLQRQVLATTAIAMVGLLWSAAAAAQTPPADDTGLIDQYRESVPTTKGPRVPGGDADSTSALSSGLQTELYAATGTDAQLLERVATSSRYGAPERTALESRVLNDAGSDGNPAAAAFGALLDRDGGHPIILVAGLFLVTGVALGVAAARRRESRASPGAR